MQVFIPLLSFNQQRNKESIDKLKLPPGTARRPSTARSTSTARRPSSQPSGSENGNESTEQEVEAPQESYSVSLLRDEFIVNMQKFAASAIRTGQQLDGEVRLEMPDILKIENLEEHLHILDIREQISEACLNWYNQISYALELLQKKTPQGRGPLAEIDYWRERSASLRALSEELKVPDVVRILELGNQIDNSNSFEYLKQDLNKFHTEAKDNVRFLSTLERHFKNVTHGASFQSVIDTLPSMMNALRMVWIISRHYNRDERMVPLMERIAWELAERVSRTVVIRTLFS